MCVHGGVGIRYTIQVLLRSRETGKVEIENINKVKYGKEERNTCLLRRKWNKIFLRHTAMKMKKLTPDN